MEKLYRFPRKRGANNVDELNTVAEANDGETKGRRKDESIIFG